MKPGSRDMKHPIRITGLELEELKKQTWMMAEAFGLDRRIEKYSGARAIGFWPWDLDCLVDVVDLALMDAKQYPGKKGPRYEAMMSLRARLVELRKGAYGETSAGR